MNNGQIRDLCVGLLHAESEDEVIELLKKAGYWEDPTLWRYYGDVENNELSSNLGDGRGQAAA